MKSLIFTFFAILMTTVTSFSQWSNDPQTNLLISGATGEQALPKITNTADQGTYICWFDNRSGSYAVYLQRLNSLGEAQLGDGLLISNNSQSSSLVDYDMITDDSGNAIISFTDTRNGSEINPFVYKISPDGNFLWGANGINLANDFNTFQPNPRLAKTTDNSIVVAWVYSSTPNKIALQKISPGGDKLWGTDPIYLAGDGTENFTFPAMVTSNNNAVILLWSGYSGNFLNPANYKLYSQKYSSSGTVDWKDTVYSLGNVNGFFVPKIFSDENYGALYVWQDFRSSGTIASSYVQHINSSGNVIFPVNGSESSTDASMNKYDAWASYMPSTNETYLVWKQANGNQNQYGIYGQKFSSNGGRLWTDNGMAFVPMGSNSYVNQVCFTYDTTIVYAFNESVFGSNNNFQKAFSSDRNGNIGWGGNIKDISSILSPKSKVVATISDQGMTKIVWSDERNSDRDIYAQNVNSNGTLGNTGVNIISHNQPEGFELFQNYPNPFNPNTIISYSLRNSANVKLKIFDVLGNEVSELVDQKQNSGSYKITFDGAGLSSGIYYYTLNVDNILLTKNMLLLK
ncbi:MAG TPA: T9SS type A sorting domain-containing protein [Ignavibacteria bacterium]|nr:T9SS type A sorting domain-containing protein [Ignavibacteria bacterium]HMR39559.1 T9SS type A sorting domain-containing protein [Ignavibacteria bacterium]